MYAIVVIYLAMLCTFKPNHAPRCNVNKADFDNMHAAFYTTYVTDILPKSLDQEVSVDIVYMNL